ncbi:unnamed protein product [Pleuronectes platessa]|uniref:Uncharacterized protein n=1 Tax=Pleuronectes platessa TaxID=8262 RepID=A0A9N7VZP9_PLEPL|nr:unnamed protein product [Pleuronectes platessa]
MLANCSSPITPSQYLMAQLWPELDILIPARLKDTSADPLGVADPLLKTSALNPKEELKGLASYAAGRCPSALRKAGTGWRGPGTAVGGTDSGRVSVPSDHLSYSARWGNPPFARGDLRRCLIKYQTSSSNYIEGVERSSSNLKVGSSIPSLTLLHA